MAHLVEQVAPLLAEVDCTLIADRGLSCLKLIGLCQAHCWHYVLRIKQDEYVQRKRYGHVHDWQSCSQVFVPLDNAGMARCGSGRSTSSSHS